MLNTVLKDGMRLRYDAKPATFIAFEVGNKKLKIKQDGIPKSVFKKNVIYKPVVGETCLVVDTEDSSRHHYLAEILTVRNADEGDANGTYRNTIFIRVRWKDYEGAEALSPEFPYRSLMGCLPIRSEAEAIAAKFRHTKGDPRGYSIR
jgi:hypothetical protein